MSHFSHVTLCTVRMRRMHYVHLILPCVKADCIRRMRFLLSNWQLGFSAVLE